MSKQIFDPSDTVENRIKKLETVVVRLARRAIKKTKAIITPFPISSYSSGDHLNGDILKYMFCVSGVINKCLITLNDNPESGAVVKITIENDFGSESKTYYIVRKRLLIEPKIDILSGDRLTISLEINNPEDKINEAWSTLIWTPDVKDTDIKEFLISELEKDMAEEFGSE